MLHRWPTIEWMDEELHIFNLEKKRLKNNELQYNSLFFPTRHECVHMFLKFFFSKMSHCFLKASHCVINSTPPTSKMIQISYNLWTHPCVEGVRHWLREEACKFWNSLSHRKNLVYIRVPILRLCTVKSYWQNYFSPRI